MFIHRKIGLKKTTDRNELPIQCSSSGWQTRKESKHSFILPVLNMRSPQNGAVAVTNFAKHWDPAAPAAGSVQGGAAKQLRAPGLGRWANPSSRPTALHRGHQPLNILSLSLLLASWVVLQPCICCYPPVSIFALTSSVVSVTPHCHSHCMVPVSWFSQCKDATSLRVWGSQPKQWEYPIIQCSLPAICSTQCSLNSITVLLTPTNWNPLLDGKELIHL